MTQDEYRKVIAIINSDEFKKCLRANYGNIKIKSVGGFQIQNTEPDRFNSEIEFVLPKEKA